MNVDPADGRRPDANMDDDVDDDDDDDDHHQSSASPAATGSSPSRDEWSSVHTTPPPPVDDENNPFAFTGRDGRGFDAKRRSSYGSAYSRSYQSTYSLSTHADLTSPGTPSFNRLSQASFDVKAYPSTSVIQGDEDEADLAAAVGLLSCSHGTPRSGPLVVTDDDVPPVPPLPARFAGEKTRDVFAHGHLASSLAIVPAHVHDKDEATVDDDGHTTIARRPISSPFSSGMTPDDEDDSVFGRIER